MISITRLVFCLSILMLPVVWSEAAEIVPDQELQAQIDATAIRLRSGITQEEGLTAIKELEQRHANKSFLIQQLMLYLRFNAKTEERIYGAIIILNKLDVDKTTRIKAAIPQLDSSDIQMQKIATDVLRLADKDKSLGGKVDFCIYDGMLKEAQTNPPSALIRYMFDRNPQAAVVTLSRIYGQNVPESEIVTKAKSGVKESVDYFSGRSEWWAHLYVATMMEKEPYLRTPEMIKKLEQDTDPLVREKVTKLKQNQSGDMDVSQQTTNQTAVVVPQIPGAGKTNDLGASGNTGKPSKE